MKTISILPNSNVESLGADADQQFHDKMIMDAINRIDLPATDVVKIALKGDGMIHHIRTMNQLLVNVASAQWVEGFIEKLLRVRPDILNPDNNVYKKDAIILGLINELKGQLKSLETNVDILNHKMNNWNNPYAKGLIYEDELPEDISQEVYNMWAASSQIIDGVRMGNPIDQLPFVAIAYNNEKLTKTIRGDFK